MQQIYTAEQINRLIKGVFDIVAQEIDTEIFAETQQYQFDDLLSIVDAAASTIGIKTRPDRVTSCNRDYQDGDAGKWRYGVTSSIMGCNLAVWLPHVGLEELQIKHYDEKYRLTYKNFSESAIFQATSDRKNTILGLAYFMQTGRLTPSLEWKLLKNMEA